MAIRVTIEGDHALQQIAHVIHENRHTGDNFFCPSDAAIAEHILNEFKTKGWVIVKIT